MDRSQHSPNIYRLPFFALLILCGVLLWRFARFELALHNPRAQAKPVTARGDLAEDEKATIQLFRAASPSVVFITTSQEQKPPAHKTDLHGMTKSAGQGTGIVWDRQGHILTNFHVLGEETASWTVTLADHSSWPASFVGASKSHDIAVLRIFAPPTRLAPIRIGTSRNLQVGQKVFAIGNPYGFDQTLSTGVISALGRIIKPTAGSEITGAIQTDAPINPGNSGGPLLDSAGLLIGVNTALFSPNGSYAGIGFAIPVDTINLIVTELIQTGRIRRPALGVNVSPGALEEEFGLKGVMILNVSKGGAAEKAGLLPFHWNQAGHLVLGDLLVAINQDKIENISDLYQVLGKHSIGETVQVTVLRRGTQRLRIPVKLQAFDPN
ncbi:MAG TPA: PDZ domain-containing protein [Planctomycetes bacterium]|nr:PDZ domain-containing protein [Planctomycetota bacterium]